MTKAHIFNYEGEPNRCYEVLQEARSLVESDDQVAARKCSTESFTSRE